jgi:hypothetical protein
MREHRALNHDACAWARNHTHRFPVDRRPLKRRVRTSGNGSARPGPGALRCRASQHNRPSCRWKNASARV